LWTDSQNQASCSDDDPRLDHGVPKLCEFPCTNLIHVSVVALKTNPAVLLNDRSIIIIIIIIIDDPDIIRLQPSFSSHKVEVEEEDDDATTAAVIQFPQ
jgi:hypothetical protein